MTAPTATDGWWTVPGRQAHQLGPDGHPRCRSGSATYGRQWAPASDDVARCQPCALLEGYVTAADLQDVGPSYRQVDYWTHAGWLRTAPEFPGSGRSRRYPPDEVPVARAMAVLTAAGVAPAAAERAARTGELAPGVRVSIDPAPTDQTPDPEPKET